MAKFVVEFEYSVDREGRQELHPAHAANLYDLAERGVLLLGGPLADVNAGLLVYEVEGRERLDQLLAEEPYVKGGIVARTRVREWSPGKGSWIEALNQPTQHAA
ncbi:YciI family protein [Streptacidiphilus sp. MAP5-3]|uniref:YciI family protein n=1 Tax=unclassified Streptacidiphilus TaxID=2643834 RepID=UPI0035145749